MLLQQSFQRRSHQPRVFEPIRHQRWLEQADFITDGIDYAKEAVLECENRPIFTGSSVGNRIGSFDCAKQVIALINLDLCAGILNGAFPGKQINI
ncbi:MAG: hypothetical protein LBC83_07295 [Oscillospiraceae bacterium]|nr:hypothetical protein [Oscillospiraceae bacterium]